MSLQNMFQILLRNLSGAASPEGLEYVGAEGAHQALCEQTGQDFGYDVERWRAWLKENMPLRMAYDLVLANLAGRIAEGDLGWMPRETAHKKLITISGVDFGYDVERWREWLQKNKDIALQGHDHWTFD